MRGADGGDEGMLEERRIVTVVFADIAGSTALGERLDVEDLKLVIGDAVARMVEAVESFGGTIKDLAGDGVLSLFGAPVAHEDDAERAVRAALKVADDLAEYAREVERAWGIAGFGVRVGVQTGPVVVGAMGGGSRIEYAALGDAVNTAARLQERAVPGTVLVGESTYAAVEQLFQWDAPVELELKGKADAITARTVTGLAAAPDFGRGIGRTRAPLVGRARELEVAERLVRAALEGSGGVLFVVGEPGIGKTRLRAELRDRFRRESPLHGRALWLQGRCVSYGESMPYWPFRDLLRSWVDVRADEPELRVRVRLRRSVDELFGDRAEELAPYLGVLLGLSPEPEVAARLAELSPEAMQYRTFEVLQTLLVRLAADGPVALAIEDLHWADATSLQLLERVFADTETAALLVILTSRLERDHPSWRVKESAERELPHRTTSIELEALSGDAGRELLSTLVGEGTLPPEMERRILEPAEGNPFFLEELIRSLIDAGALVRSDGGWRFDHEVAVEVPPTVEKVILSRIDGLSPASRRVLVGASVLGRQFGLPLLEATAGADVGAALPDLMRADLIREGRRWPEPEYRFKHALIQEAAYRTLVSSDRRRLHRTAADWLEHHPGGREHEAAGLLAHHWLAAEDEERAAGYLTLAGDRARQEYALDEAIHHYRDLVPILMRRGEELETATVLFKLALALHMSLRFAEANDIYQQAFSFWTEPSAASSPSASLRIATSFLPNDPDPRSAIAWPNIQLCMQLFDRLVEQRPERTIVPSLAERWEISDDGLRYVFHLRAGLRWSDGEPLTARDVEFGIRRVLDPDVPGSSVAIYFALENGQDYYLRNNADADRIGVRAVDDRTVEFRLSAPAPYFMSVMNRPDGGPQPRHAIERYGDDWTDPARQVVSGAFRQVSRSQDGLVLERRSDDVRPRSGNVARVEYVRTPVGGAIEPYGRDELDMIAVRYTPRLADLMPAEMPDASLGPATWSGYLAFDHGHPDTSNLHLRLALAHAVDREVLAAAMPVNMIVAGGGIVPPALQGHTPDIALRCDPERARHHLKRSGFQGSLPVACLEDDLAILHPVLEAWRATLGIDVEARPWTLETVAALERLRDAAPVYFTGWLPGYADPEYFLRLLFQSTSRTNEGGFAHPPFDALIERARQERSDRGRLALFHEADRMAVADRVAVIPLVYGRSLAIVKPWVRGWWEFGKTSATFAGLTVDPTSPRA
jgi:ABC-type oligopeptide transport system substrate-binding subunit/class 3 adenylate cyclase